ncbi:MAG: acyl carrier protein [Symploca sp. SIO1C4]|uniref:Acyl carrier protein n=1 Tax=Symploca sp. SIO1C4 TaxID=2607765 RepID=A0A6B3NCK5_9CYAN|nr:acyl carrier protein [Symploca sp. SIO1C4]
MTTTTELITKVKEWLLAKHPDISELELDFDLINNRIIDSLSFQEFMFFLEDITGRELQTEAQSINPFRTLRAIEHNILQSKNTQS